MYYGVFGKVLQLSWISVLNSYHEYFVIVIFGQSKFYIQCIAQYC